MITHDTIAAIATPAGHGGVGIVRVSGPEARTIIARLVPNWPSDHPTHRLRLSRLVDHQGALIDEALVVVMRGPRSYTAEDVAEFQCHGGPIVLRRVLDATLRAGARAARPGEFTQRAYLNGRLDLTQAEAVADLVNARSEASHKLAIEHLQGHLGDAIRAQREALMEAIVLIESALDFSHEEHVYALESSEVRRRLQGTLDTLQRLADSFDQGRRQREGILVVIAGPTNAGKSTLFNVLHGSDRAIVTDIEGTTRDFLEEQLLLGGVLVRLIDTAGLRLTSDRVESIGIERSLAWTQRADVLVWVVDQHRPLDTLTRDQIAQTVTHARRPSIAVINKADLELGLSDQDRDALDKATHTVHATLSGDQGAVADSRRAIEDTLSTLAHTLTSDEGVLLSRARHFDGVRRAIESIERALSALEQEADLEILAIDVREALDELGEIVGHVSTDDILHRIFHSFCIGK